MMNKVHIDFDELIKFLIIFDHVIFLIRIFSKVTMLGCRDCDFHAYNR